MQVNLFRQQDPLAEFSVLEPLWLTWFVAALFLWRLTNPIWTALRFPVTVAVLVSLLGGLAPIPDFIGLPQVVALLPFYVLGLTGIRRSHLDQLTRVWVRLLALAVLVGLLVVAWRRPPEWNTNWLYFRDGYGEPALGVGALEGIATRSALLALALVMSFAVLALVPQRRRWFTSLGENTLYAYLLHGFVIKWAVYEGWVQEAIPYGLAGAAVVVGLCAVLGTVLMSRPVATLFRPASSPSCAGCSGPRARRTRRSGERRAVVAGERPAAGPAPHPGGAVAVLVGDQVAHPAQGQRHQPVRAHARPGRAPAAAAGTVTRPARRRAIENASP